MSKKDFMLLEKWASALGFEYILSHIKVFKVDKNGRGKTLKLYNLLLLKLAQHLVHKRFSVCLELMKDIRQMNLY